MECAKKEKSNKPEPQKKIAPKLANHNWTFTQWWQEGIFQIEFAFIFTTSGQKYRVFQQVLDNFILFENYLKCLIWHFPPIFVFKN